MARAHFIVAALLITIVGVGAATAASRTVREPAFGLPHFYGDTDVELARENGREIAKDRLGQLILLARVGRGTLYQVFGLLDPTTLDDDIEARSTAYTSSELNRMFERLPQASRDVLMAYCDGVNDTIEAIYAGTFPEPLEVSALRELGFTNDLFGNATIISDQIDPFYRAPGDDAQRPNGGFQFTPEMAIAIGVLEIRNFGVETFDEPRRLNELQALVRAHGEATGMQIWDDINFLNDPLAPVTVPDPATPGYGGSLSSRRVENRALIRRDSFPQRDYAALSDRRAAAAAAREEFAARWGAWPKLGSYAWAIAGNRSESGNPWLGGFPQTGIQTPSLMHFADNRSAEGIQGVGMEFAGGPFVLIGHSDSVAWTSTTAQLRTGETYIEEIVLENADRLRHIDEGSPSPLSARVETFRGNEETSRTFWRSRVRDGNGGTRSVIEFMGDVDGMSDGSTGGSFLAVDGSFDQRYVDGYLAILSGRGAGQIRRIAEVESSSSVRIDSGAPWAELPDRTSSYVAVRAESPLIAVALESPIFLEESTSILGFSLMQRATTISDIESAARLMPSTHNFLAADNRPFAGIGTESGNGNIGYWSSGFSRVRQDATDPRLPIDGAGPNPFVIVAGTVETATSTSLQLTDAFAGRDFSPPPPNFRYLDPMQVGSEYVVAILSGAGGKQTRRIASNTGSILEVEYPWGVVPEAGDAFEVYEIVAMPEAINPAEGYLANWNNKAATADEGLTFGRQFRHIFILERLAATAGWNRAEQRQLNRDVAGLEGKGALGRFLVPRLQQAVQAAGAAAADVEAIVDRLVAHNRAPSLGRLFVDPVLDTTVFGEVAFLNTLSDRLARNIYGDELSAAFAVPRGALGLNIVQHAIDTAAGDLPGGYPQSYAGDYLNGRDWRELAVDTLRELASEGGIPSDTERPLRRYRHPLAAVRPELEFEPTLAGNRGTWEQIVEVGPEVRGEFIFPLGQSGMLEGSLAAVDRIDPNFDSLQPIWRDWRFVPMLNVSREMVGGGDEDSDGDGVPDAYERWYFGDLDRDANDDRDGDGLGLRGEYVMGAAPTVADTDGDGTRDGFDLSLQDRLTAQCVADCNDDGSVGINELIRGVNIALGNDDIESCAVFDLDGNGRVAVSELIRGVRAALGGCRVLSV